MSEAEFIFDEKLSPEPIWMNCLPGFLKKKINDHCDHKQIIINIWWLFLDKIMRMGGGLVMTILIARYLGPERFGIINYATVFVAMFAVLGTLGLDGIVVKDIVDRPAKKYLIMGTAFWLKLAASIVSYILLIVTVLFLENEYMVKISVFVIGIGMILQAFDVIRLWFESQIKSRYPVIALNGAFIISAIIKIFLLIYKAAFIYFIWAILLEAAIGVLWLVIYYKSTGELMKNWKFKYNIYKKLIVNSLPLMFTSIAILVYMRISLLMLGGFIDQHEVGIFSAALRISEIWYFIPTIVSISVYPKLIQIYNENEELYTHKLMRLLNIFFWFSLVFSILIVVFSKTIIFTLYGNSYAAAYPVLTILIFSSIISSVSIIFSHWFILKNQQKLSLYATIAGGVVSVLLNLLLIPKYSAKGAAIATLISGYVPVIFFTIFIDRSVGMILLRSVFYFSSKKSKPYENRF